MKRVIGSPRTSLVVAATVVLLALATTVVTSFAPSVHPRTAGISMPTLLPPDTAADLGVRTLPLTTPGGTFETSFPDGVRPQDADQLADAIQVVAERVGLGDWVLYLTSREIYPSIGNYSYPFDYGEIDDLVDSLLTTDAVTTSPGDVLDLASMLAVLGAVEWENPEFDAPYNLAGPVAYSILRRAVELAPSCDLQTSLAWVVSLGANPQAEPMRLETDRAAELCGADDPTPLWLFAATVGGSVVRPMFSGVNLLLPSELVAISDAAFAELRERFPDLPVGWAGLADVYLSRADEVAAARSAPFQVRAWRREALALYETARSKSASPALLPGHAQALASLGRYDDALEVLGSAPDQTGLRVRIGTSRALFAAGRWSEAAIDARLPVVLPHWVQLRQEQSLGLGVEVLSYGVIPDYTLNEAGGAFTDDRGYLPRARRGTEVSSICRGQAELVALLLDRLPDEALARIDEGLTAYRVDDITQCEVPDGSETATEEIRGWASMLQGESPPDEDADRDYGELQNLLRTYGELTAAAEVNAAWVKDAPESPRAWRMSGETHYLLEDYAEAERDLERALDLVVRASDDWSVGEPVGEGEHRTLRVQLAAVAEAQGDIGRAEGLLESVVAEPLDDSTDYFSEAARFYALSDLGRLQAANEEWAAAAQTLADALDERLAANDRFTTFGQERSERILSGLSKGAQHNNLALALSNLDDDEAIDVAVAARRQDPASPIFRDTLAYALQGAGQTERAVRLYRAALASDPTSYVSATNLAVLLATDDPGSKEARRLLDQATRIDPGYALAWHNLGVVQSQTWSPLDFLRGQRSLAKAHRLDGDLRGAGLTLLADETVYESGVDVSAPLPPDWTYGASARDRGDGFVWTLVLLLLLRVAWALGLDRVSELVLRLAETHQDKVSWWRGPWTASWALAVSLAIVLWTGVARMGWSSGLLVSTAAVAAVVALPLTVRAAHSPGAGLRAHYTWPPGVAAGATLSVVGLTFVPYPALRERPDGDSVRARWVGPLALAASCLVFVLLSLVTAVPLAGLLAATSLAVLASMLTPVPPFDGAEIKGRLVNLAVTVGLTVATALAALHFI